ncbi:MAG: VWA domain-containing protein [Promethearchaeia archaeon]
MSALSERISENIIILMDTSRSMYRHDYHPSRLKACIPAVKKLISDRLEEDTSTGFAIIKFSDDAEKITEFTNVTSQLFESLDTLEYGGISALGDALAQAIKSIIAELRKIAAKVPRILVVSDGNYTKTAVDPLKMARLCQGLSIKIDTFRLGEVSHLNIMKRLSDLTSGRYYYNNNADSLMEAAHDLAESNIKTLGSESESPIENPAFLRKIAAPLLRSQDLTKDQEQKLKAIRGEGEFKKCSICFSEEDSVTGAPFYLSGRYCPNCQTPFHIHCLQSWADSQKDEKSKDSGTVRCPHCYYLLKIPSEVSQAKKLRNISNKRKKVGGSTGSEVMQAKKMDISELGDEALYQSCPVCHLIFEENDTIIKCGNPDCGALYHEECFKKLKDSRCKNCGVKLTLY